MNILIHNNNTAVSLKVLLITDFDIDCLSNSYYSFMPVVLVVLGIYTAALFTVILFIYLNTTMNVRDFSVSTYRMVVEEVYIYEVFDLDN